MTLERINHLDSESATKEFLRCCGSRRWAQVMAARRPFAHEDTLLASADEVWNCLAREDWLEAFAAHPKIGDVDALRQRFKSTAAWSAHEQGGVAEAGLETLGRLAQGNRHYEARFGYIFIVCASGKNANEMLVLLEERLHNDAETELRIAADEQAKITHLRLQRLLA